MKRSGWIATVASVLVAQASAGQLHAQSQNAAWPTYGHDYANSRHVPLRRINSATVQSLRLAWKFESGTYGKLETTPIVVGRTMYLTLPPDDTVVALDATNGQVRWKYKPTLASVRLCCGPVNRGVAVDRFHVYVATLDARLLALDKDTGALRWQANVADPKLGYSETMAPLAWNGLIFVGVSGGDVGIRGSLSAYSAQTGKLRWRWWSVAAGWEGQTAAQARPASAHADAWRNGGGPIWMTPALDESRATIYGGVGNPFPSINGDERPGKNLYTDSIVALDANSGRLRWYYQEVPHDLWDYDASSPPLLFTMTTPTGQRIAAVGQAGKTGWLYILNRDSGTLIKKSDAFVTHANMFAKPTPQGVYSQPAGGSGAIAPPAFNPLQHLVYITFSDQRHFARSTDPYWKPAGAAGSGIVAIDIASGRITWQRRFPSAGLIDGGLNAMNGPCATDDLVFVGEESTGLFDALDAKNGNVLWQFQTSAGNPGSGAALEFRQKLRDVLAALKHKLFREPQPQPESHIHNSPIAYVVDGVEYVAIGGDAFYRLGDSSGNTLYVFALPR